MTWPTVVAFVVLGSPVIAQPWMDKALSPDKRAELLVPRLTLDEKISLVHGLGWGGLLGRPTDIPAGSLGGAGFIRGIPRLGIPELQMADAAVGVSRGLCSAGIQRRFRRVSPKLRVGT